MSVNWLRWTRLTGPYPTLLFVAAITLLTPQADATRPSTRCAPGPIAAGAAAATAPQPADDETFTVASLNMAADVRTAEVLEAWTHQRSIDVLLLQEVGDDDDDVDGKILSAALGNVSRIWLRLRAGESPRRRDNGGAGDCQPVRTGGRERPSPPVPSPALQVAVQGRSRRDDRGAELDRYAW